MNLQEQRLQSSYVEAFNYLQLSSRKSFEELPRGKLDACYVGLGKLYWGVVDTPGIMTTNRKGKPKA